MGHLRRAIVTTVLSALVVACGSTASPSPTAQPGPSATSAQPTAAASAAASPSPAAPVPASASPSPAPSAAPSPVAGTGALTGAIPVALRGTWRLKGTNGHWVFGTDRAASYGETLADGHTLLGAGTSGDELSLGPRLDDPGLCQKIGLYHWKLVSPGRLSLRPVFQDPCPRGQGLLHADFIYLGPSTAAVDKPAAGLPAACPLVASGEIDALRGVVAGFADPSESTPGASDCIWTISDTDGRVVLEVNVAKFDPAVWASDTTAADHPTHGSGWVGSISAGNQSLMTIRANGYLVRLGLPGSIGTSTADLERQESSVADLVVSRLAPIH